MRHRSLIVSNMASHYKFNQLKVSHLKSSTWIYEQCNAGPTQPNQVWHAFGNSGRDLLKLCWFVKQVVSFSCDNFTYTIIIVTSAILFFYWTTYPECSTFMLTLIWRATFISLIARLKCYLILQGSKIVIMIPIPNT